jgi:hypothetical protein
MLLLFSIPSQLGCVKLDWRGPALSIPVHQAKVSAPVGMTTSQEFIGR